MPESALRVRREYDMRSLDNGTSGGDGGGGGEAFAPPVRLCRFSHDGRQLAVVYDTSSQGEVQLLIAVGYTTIGYLFFGCGRWVIGIWGLNKQNCQILHIHKVCGNSIIDSSGFLINFCLRCQPRSMDLELLDFAFDLLLNFHPPGLQHDPATPLTDSSL